MAQGHHPVLAEKATRRERFEKEKGFDVATRPARAGTDKDEHMGVKRGHCRAIMSAARALNQQQQQQQQQQPTAAAVAAAAAAAAAANNSSSSSSSSSSSQQQQQ